MAGLKIGVDVDGVLANFNDSFIERVIKVTGEDKFPPRPFDITTWDYPQVYGYSSKQVSAVWEDIKEDISFWSKLDPYPYTAKAVFGLAHMWQHDLYFITSRPGFFAKTQTEAWLMQFGSNLPTVLICNHGKGEVAAALDLDYYIDDKLENCDDVKQHSPATKVYLFTQPWNSGRTTKSLAVKRIRSIDEFINAILGEQRTGDETL